MATRVIMPKQGLQMTEGTITKWLVAEGGAVKAGEPLFEMETDKLTITIDAAAGGTLLKIVRKEWETVPITELIAVIGEAGENIDAILAEASASAAASSASEQKEAKAVSPAQTSAAAPITAAVRAVGERILISPRAKRLAEEREIDYALIAGSGEGGMIVERDILPYRTDADRLRSASLASFQASPTQQGASAPASAAAAGAANNPPLFPTLTANPEDTVVKIAGMRRAVCENMTTSLRSMAQANHKISADMSAAVKIRSAYKARGEKISYNDIILYYTARTLAAFPAMNAVSDAANVYRRGRVNLGVAVALETGLIVPTLRDADRLSFQEIHERTIELAQKAKSGALEKADYSDGSFTVTNLGMYGLDEFVAIINPPQVGILAVGAIQERAVVRDGQIMARPMVTLTLTYDHRVIDGAPAAEFLKMLKDALEEGETEQQ